MILEYNRMKKHNVFLFHFFTFSEGWGQKHASRSNGGRARGEGVFLLEVMRERERALLFYSACLKINMFVADTGWTTFSSWLLP